MILKLILINFIRKGIQRIMLKKLRTKILESKFLKGKLTYVSIATLAVGAIAGAIGIDLAPTEVDAIVTALAVLGGVIGKARAVWQGR